MPECPFLTECTAAFTDAKVDFEELVAGLDSNQANWKPSPKGWSVAECIEHLNVAADGYLSRTVKAILKGREKGLIGTAPYTQRSLLGQFILRALDPEAQRRVPAPRVFRPRAGGLDFDEVCRRFRSDIEAFRDLAEEADGLALGRIKMATPFAPFPRLNLAEAFGIHIRHIPRHLAQATRVTRMPGFPAGN